MREEGLTEVLNPSEIFLEERSAGVSGINFPDKLWESAKNGHWP
ncbi:hypothetical protein CGLO_14513 [Colletotrichum gloeosporioides Cg-14]|uniref:Uncharacterized protein n=1 Tax=Colletotrichum gloeosporioides (strain Cg-14) TaxID=1237896 RepID=T0K143_COLGC|nr:hypothetical protein CGLO_14513 [Colletotrichum gloeosporioides Cg-14]